MTATTRSRTLLPFFFGAPLIGALIYFSSTWLHLIPPWAVFLALAVLTVLIMLPGIYAATLARVHDNALLNRSGWLFRLRSRRMLITIRWFLWALVSGYLMLLQLNLYTRAEWLLFFLNFLAFLAIFLFAHHLLRSQAHLVHALRFAIVWTRWLLPVIMALLAAVVLWQLDAGPSTKSLKEAIAVKRAHMSGTPSSAVVEESLRAISLAAGLRDHAETQIASLSTTIGKAIAVLSAAVISFNVVLVLSCLMIPPAEYRRLFGSMSDDPVPPAVSTAQVATFAAVVTILFLFIFLQGFAALEAHWRQSSSGIAKVEEDVVRMADRIGDVLYETGTIEKVERAREELYRQLAADVPALEQQVDAAFAAMAANVDPYLDWYYGLPAEYLRLGAILTGNLETRLEEELREHLLEENAFAVVEERLRAVAEAHKAALEDFIAMRDRLLSGNKIDDSGPEYVVTSSASLDQLSFLPAPPVHIDVGYRLGGAAATGAVTGAVTGLVAAKVAGKAAGKGILKLAAMAVSKASLSKFAGAAAGAATGAAVGSLVPGVGTLIGSVSGFLVGLASGVAVDAVLLELEERMSRADFRKRLLESIAEVQSEFKRNVFAEPQLPPMQEMRE